MQDIPSPVPEGVAMVSSPTVYDAIGRGYAGLRQPDPRLERRIHDGLGGAESVVNIGAGAGSYEPTDRRVVAVEPSSAMLAQRSGSVPAVQGVARALPFRDHQFDAAMAILTVHHWVDHRAGLREMRRVAERHVVFTFDLSQVHEFWLVDEYLPEIGNLEADRNPPLELIADELGARRIEPVPIAWDWTDGVQCAYWRRPERYLEPAVQQSISTLAQLDATVRARGLQRLADDLASGAWHERHADLLDQDEADFGYRLIVTD